jgi:hypothetical protein
MTLIYKCRYKQCVLPYPFSIANKPSPPIHQLAHHSVPSPRIFQHTMDDLLHASLTHSIDEPNYSVPAVACVGAGGVCLE